MVTDEALAAHAALVAKLRDAAAYAHPVGVVDVVETHISSVLLAGEYAYKLKKPVDLGFVDFSTLEQRRHYCHEEVRLNRRSAPGLYLDVVPVTARDARTADVRPHFGGAGVAIDYAVRMRRFDQDARLDQMARTNRLSPQLIDHLATGIAAFHTRCDPATAYATYGKPEEICRWTSNNLAELRRLLPDADQPRLAALAQWTEQEFARRAATFTARRAAGHVRECHGDLHLANLVLIDGAPVPFDCIEFNSQLRYIDTMSDVAFVWMDLIRHGLPQLAARFLNRYVEATGDYAGLATLRFYAVYRALVRAKVSLIRRAQRDHEPDAAADGQALADRSYEGYLVAAEQLASVRRPLLVLMCGVTGSGKTTVAQLLLEKLGAVRVRSDIERKRRAAVDPSEHVPAAVGAGLYEDRSTRATYDELARAAVAIIDAGLAAIMDATFQRRSDRATYAALAERRGARLALVQCEAPLAILQARVAQRLASGHDASDATRDVLAHQLAGFEWPAGDEAPFVHPIDTDTDAATLAARCDQLAATLDAGAPPHA